MNRRTKYLIGIVFIVFSLSLPHVLQAQGGLSLEGLSGTVQELTSDFNIFARDLVRVNDRLDSIEAEILSLREEEKNQVEGTEGQCVLSARENGHMRNSSQLRAETLNGYVSRYGGGMESFWVFDINFHPVNESLLVRYRSIMGDQNVLEVVEKWQGCRFLGFEFKER